jgi:hypothetical protein
MTKGCLTAPFSAPTSSSTGYEVHDGCARARSHALDRFEYWQTRILCVRPRRASSADNIAAHNCRWRANIFIARLDTSARFSFSVAIQDDSLCEVSFRIDRECAECLHARIAAFKTGEVGKAPGTAIQPSPAFSAKDGSASGGVR